MNLSFLLLAVAALIFRYLASRSSAAFSVRVTSLLRREIPRNRLASVLREHPNRLAEFRSRALPLSALQVLLDFAACATLVVALYVFPPAKFGPTDLALFQDGSVAVVSIALLADLVMFGLTLRAAFTPVREPEPAE